MKTNQPVCVTGASGFIATHIVRELLQQGYRVRGTVRKGAANYPFLLNLPGANERLELVPADLLISGAYDAAVDGCDYVMHTASPYQINVKDPQRNLVDPALIGTTNLLESCMKSKSVRRVILTSSIAAITDQPESGKSFTEEDWNTMSSLNRQPYQYSKTVAERKAWEFVINKRPAFDVVVINPAMVIGPSLNPSLNTTNQIIRDIMSGVYPGIMDLNWGFVDVRDVAKAHLLAMATDAASGRYLCSAEMVTMNELVSILKTSGVKRYALPKLDLSGTAGTMLMKLLSFTQSRDTGSYIRLNVGRTMRYNNAKIKRELGILFKPFNESLLATVTDMERWGHLKPPKR
jgi:dihydroflavonol-4-reductase